MKWLPTLIILLVGCTKEGTVQEHDPIPPGRILVNELQAKSSTTVNEFGEEVDWLELYNPGPAITLTEGEWFLSDDVERTPCKFELPELTLPTGGYALVYCDGMDNARDLHTNFKLSKKDRSVAIVHQDAGGATIVDEVPVVASSTTQRSFGRLDQQRSAWTMLTPPSPGAPNPRSEK